MTIRSLLRFFLVIPLAIAAQLLRAEPGAVEKPVVEDLGQGRLRIGAILLDRETGSFTLPGQVIRLEPPLEYLASTKGGVKAYETLLELDANAVEFNTACILLGLEADRAVRSGHHFDERVVEGDAVGVMVGWKDENGEEKRLPAEQLLKRGESPVTKGDWVYTGSFFDDDNRYYAEMNGTLIGFVHDPSSIIEHAKGLGLGEYGLIGGNPTTAPPLGTRIVLTVSRGQ